MSKTAGKQPKREEAVRAPGPRQAERVLHWLRDYVEERGMALGGPLPNEQEIGEATGASRTSVRDALNRLRAMGIVHTRRRRGMLLTRPIRLLDLVELLAKAEPSGSELADIGGVRSALELGLTPLILRNATPEATKRLRALYERMVADRDDVPNWHRLDQAFHATLIGISGNRPAIWFWDLLGPFFQWIAPRNEPTVPDVVLERHRMLLEALERRDAYAFDFAMRDHHLRKLAPTHHTPCRSRKKNRSP